MLVQDLDCWSGDSGGGDAFFSFWFGECLVPFLEKPPSALGGHPHQARLGKETFALDGETRGDGLGWPSCLPPLTV